MEILRKIETDIPIETAPFKAMAREMGVTEDEVINRIKKAFDDGHIRRFGAVLDHNTAGYLYNSMLVWQLPEEKVDEVGKALAQKQCVSHCYRREVELHWPYNLYAMTHAKNEEEGSRFVNELKEIVGTISPKNSFRELKTLKEFKKVSFKPL